MATAKKVATKKVATKKVAAKKVVTAKVPVKGATTKKTITPKPAQAKVTNKKLTSTKEGQAPTAAMPLKKAAKAIPLKNTAAKGSSAGEKKLLEIGASKKSSTKKAPGKKMAPAKGLSVGVKSGASAKTALNPQAAWPFPTGTKP